MFDNWDTEIPALSADQQIEALKRAIESVQGFALWVTLALAAVLIGVAVLMRFKFPAKLRAYAGVAAGVAVGYAVTLISVILYMQISRMSLKGELDVNFWLWVGLAAYALAAAVACTLVKLFAPKAFKYVFWAALALFAAYVIVILCLFPTAKDTNRKTKLCTLSFRRCSSPSY